MGKDSISQEKRKNALPLLLSAYGMLETLCMQSDFHKAFCQKDFGIISKLEIVSNPQNGSLLLQEQGENSSIAKEINRKGIDFFARTKEKILNVDGIKQIHQFMTKQRSLGKKCGGTYAAFAAGLVTSGVYAGRTLLTGYLGWQLKTRFRDEGIAALFGLQTYIEVLAILSTIKLPAKWHTTLNTSRPLSLKINNAVIPVSPSILKYQNSLASFLKNFAIAQREQARWLVRLGLAYGSIQILNAESIAKRRQENGYQVDSKEIRRQGASNIVLGIIGGANRYRSHKDYMKKSPSYQKYWNSRRWNDAPMVSFAARYSMIRPIQNLVKGFKASTTGHILKGLNTMLVGGLAMGYWAFLSWGSWTLYSIIHWDFVFNKKMAKDLDQISLKKNESILLMNGFHPNDFMYHMFATDYANRDLINRYGDKVRGRSFDSADGFFKTLSEHAKQYGKIKILKIMAHGVPGTIVPKSSPGNTSNKKKDFINTEYLRTNSEKIKQIAGQALAPDAVVIFLNCLVGGNPKKEITWKGIKFKEKAGDDFMDALSQTLLFQGGITHSSERIIAGVDGVFGPLTDFMLDVDHGGPDYKRQAYQDMQLLEANMRSYSQVFRSSYNPKTGTFKNLTTTSTPEVLAFLGKRVLDLVPKIWGVHQNFGWNMEDIGKKRSLSSPWEYHRRDVHPALTN